MTEVPCITRPARSRELCTALDLSTITLLRPTIPSAAKLPLQQHSKMAKALAVVATLLAIATLAAAQSSSCPAKYRYQWFYVLQDPTAANLKAVDSLVMKWMRDDCGKVLTFGQGPAISTKPATFG